MLVAANLKRQRAARRFEVALHARLELPVAVERCGVHDRAAARLDVAGFQRIDMRLPGTVTTLAVDALRQRAIESRALAIVVRTGARG